MFRTDVVVIGGGQAGLAMSRCLSDLGLDHVVLERGQIGERWRHERWDSLQLLTPNWMTRLPGRLYDGADPNGFMKRTEVVDMLQSYGAANQAPVVSSTAVVKVSLKGDEYFVETTGGLFIARAVVVATGQCDQAHIPAMAANLPDRIQSIGSNAYKNPDQLSSGGVIVIGASASGLQLAEEVQNSGREVTLCVGRHTRVPRRYRGFDIAYWMDATGMLDQRWTDVPNVDASRRQPSLQLVGRNDNRDINLQTLANSGVCVVGRALGADPRGMDLATDLAMNAERADRKLGALLRKIDAHISGHGLRVPDADQHIPLQLSSTADRIDFAANGIGTVIWATGYKRNYGWLDVPVFDDAGEIVHDGGVTIAPGLYTLGLQFMRRRKSTFIDGVGGDAREIADHIHNFLNAAMPLAA